MTESIEKHYGTAGIVSRIVQALEEAGLDRSSIDADSLSGADEFHIGGREGTEHVATALELRESDYLLDVGCGIGGPARYFAQSSGAAVTGIDLTPCGHAARWHERGRQRADDERTRESVSTSWQSSDLRRDYRYRK